MNVYVLSNPAMPGMVKIGRTVAVEPRVEALSFCTAVPLPFAVEYVQQDADDCEVEALTHKLLSAHRINPRREFFSVSPEQAMEAIQLAALMAAWNKASAEARQEFLDRIDTPVFDRSAA